MQLKWDLFSKTGKTASTVVLLKSGELSISLGANEQRQFETTSVDFKGSDSSSTGFSGNKYYGYRLRFYYKNTLVRVVASPDSLADWESQ
jgi:hypothetical protein